MFEWLRESVDKLFFKELDKFGSGTGGRYTWETVSLYMTLYSYISSYEQ
jgi:hypothetical protein